MADDVEHRKWVIAYFSTLTAVTFGFCLVRAGSRLRGQAASFGFDDLFIALSWLSSTTMTAVTIVGIKHYGFDRHQADVVSDSLTGAIEVEFYSTGRS
jgi:hypothetical protein